MFTLDFESCLTRSQRGAVCGVSRQQDLPTFYRQSHNFTHLVDELHLIHLVAAAMAAVDDDDEYEIPLRDQRYFGAGLKRKRVLFVPSSEQAQQKSSTSLPATPRASSAADRYLSIVLGQSNTTERASSAPVDERRTASTITAQEPEKAESGTNAEDAQTTTHAGGLYCDSCGSNIAANVSRAAHEGSIAHQISLQHSYPPSHIDRDRKGLAVLQGHGWDPDSRLGLGAKGEGRLQPIKAVDNPHKAGVGARLAPAVVKEKPKRLDAGGVRKMEQERKKKTEQLARAFYMSDDVQKYLGET